MKRIIVKEATMMNKGYDNTPVTKETMMKILQPVFACSLLLTLAACGAPQDATPTATGELSSTLPRPIAHGGGDVQCGEEVQHIEVRGLEPSLPAWVQVADSIFVGTVKATGRIDSPIHLYESDVDLGPVDVSACGHVYHAMTVTFGDVETLHGEELPASFTIQMGSVYADGYPGVAVDANGDLHDAHGGRVYAPGARVGAALFKDSAGRYHWNYRQFEVLDDIVHLQELDYPSYLGCSAIPRVTQIPDELEGVSFTAFKDAITQAASVTLTEEEELSISTWHGSGTIESARFRQNLQTYCHAPETTGGVDPNGANNQPTL